MKFRDISYVFQRSELKEVSAMILCSAKPNEFPLALHGMRSSTDLITCEMTYSAIYSAALNRLCASQNRSSAIVHQGPVRKKAKTSGNPESADLVGVNFSNGSIENTVLVSDLKLYDIDVAIKESALDGKYASLHKDWAPEYCSLVLGLAASRHTASLWLYVMGDRREWAIQSPMLC